MCLGMKMNEFLINIMLYLIAIVIYISFGSGVALTYLINYSGWGCQM